MTITPRTSRAYRRRTGLLALAALVLLMLLRAAAAQASSPLPDSHAGRQMSWFLEASKRLPIPEAEVREHFAPGFLALPGHEPAEVNAFLATLVGQNGLQLRRLLSDAAGHARRERDGSRRAGVGAEHPLQSRGADRVRQSRSGGGGRCGRGAAGADRGGAGRHRRRAARRPRARRPPAHAHALVPGRPDRPRAATRGIRKPPDDLPARVPTRARQRPRRRRRPRRAPSRRPVLPGRGDIAARVPGARGGTRQPRLSRDLDRPHRRGAGRARRRTPRPSGRRGRLQVPGRGHRRLERHPRGGHALHPAPPGLDAARTTR